MTPCALVSTNLTDGSVIFAIDGERWEYFLPTPDLIRRTEFINKISPLRAFNFAKKRAWQSRKVPHAA